MKRIEAYQLAYEKKGAHGTLHRYEVECTDEGEDTGCPIFGMRIWAYSLEHVEEKFCDGDEGWRIVRIARMTDRPRHRWAWHTP